MSTIADALTRRLFGEVCVLADLPPDGLLTGLTIGDAARCDGLLQSRFACLHTRPDAPPKLDLANAGDIVGFLPVDFVVCADELSRVAPSLERACDHLAMLLRPGGVLVLAEPMHEIPATVEHVPNFHVTRVASFEGQRVLLNRTRDGIIETFADLDFPDADDRPVLRDIATADLHRLLRDAGFCAIERHGAVLSAKRAG